MAALAAVAMATLAFGCSSALPAPSGPAVALGNPANVTGTTSLLSAQIPGPAPRVGKIGKAQSSANEGSEDPSLASDAYAPKNVRRSDGSRRSGGFGSSKQ